MFRKHRAPAGAGPGVITAHKDALQPKIRIIDYDAESLKEEEVNLEELNNLRYYISTKSVTWIDVQGLGDTSVIQDIGKMFEIHPLALEDVVNVPQRPKADNFEHQVFIVTTMMNLINESEIETEQISLFIGENYLITFQQFYGDSLDPVRHRIRQAKGIIRRQKSDYLAYSVLDAILDGFYPVLEKLGEHLEVLETEVVEDLSKNTRASIYNIKRELMGLRRAIWPQRELFTALVRDETKLISKTVRVYLRDCYDHCVQVMDVVESYREISSSLTEAYLSGMSNKMNEVMKVLTIISTIFIPLSFLAGVYGMNFEVMPELKEPWGYSVFWGVIIILASLMIFQFWRMGWIGSDRDSGTDKK